VQTAKRTIHVLLDYTPSDSIITNSYWRECFYDDDFSDFNINIVEGQQMSSDSFLWSDTAYKNAQLKNILTMLQTGKISAGDIFVFTNAWNFIATQLAMFRIEYELDIKLVGFWGNGVFNKYSTESKVFRNKSIWSRHQEIQMLKTYDLNCFFSEAFYNEFVEKHRVIYTMKRVQVEVTGYPFGYLAKSSQNVEKRKKVIFPYGITDEFQVPVFKGFRFDMPEYEFIIAREEYKDRRSYKNLLNESIGIFTGKRLEWNPVVLYEGMSKGLVPFVPDTEVFKAFFPEKYQYISSLVAPKKNKMLYLVRTSFQLKEYLKEKLDDYEHWKDVVVQDADEIGKTYYSNHKFKQLLCQL